MVPRATYFALAPFIGAEAAGEVATGVGVSGAAVVESPFGAS
jgi:putative methionine-R-sulfoxide reductase with GAF domain